MQFLLQRENLIDMTENEDVSSSDSEYNVETFIKPQRVRASVNDDSADLLGNFDDAKRKEILEGTYEEPRTEDEPAAEAESTSDEATESETEENTAQDDTATPANGTGTTLSKEQLTALLRGSAKSNRHVLYVTNLNFDSTKQDLEMHFSRAGPVKSVRIPKQRRGGFAFVEMADLEGFQRGFELHNSELQGRKIKVQISEAGKKKSANKKNIIKQKNRKLAEMRHETKTFTKSGKFYDKTLKKEKAKEMLARQRWRKQPKKV